MDLDGRIEVRTQGADHPMTVWAESSCGDIKDGVAFDIGEGGWVISHEDWLRLIRAVKAARGGPVRSWWVRVWAALRGR